MVVFAVVSLGAGVVAEAAQKRSEGENGDQDVAEEVGSQEIAGQEILAQQVALAEEGGRIAAREIEAKAVVSSKTVAKKRATKRRASARAKRRVASAPRLAKLPKARSALGGIVAAAPARIRFG